MTTQKNTTAGALDPEFGNNGLVLLDIPNPVDDNVHLPGVIIVGSGPSLNLYFAGTTRHHLAFETPYVVGRLNHDGTPDPAFGTNGMVQGFFPKYPTASVVSLAIQPDRKAVIQGFFTEAGLSHTLFARLNHDGILDTDFGTDGYVDIELALLDAPNNPAPALRQALTNGLSSGGFLGAKILPDGKILACNQLGWIIRLTPEGHLDTTFNQSGYLKIVHPEFSPYAVRLNDIIVQDNGKYVAAGGIFDGDPQALFVGCDNAGNLDRSFGNNGFVVIKGSTESTGISVEAMSRQPNQRVLGLGASYARYESGVLISREPDGTPNIQFNRGEPLYTSLENDKRTLWTGAGLQKDGKIVVAGALGISSEYEVVIARFINATFDPSFGDNGQGWVRTQVLGPGSRYASTLALQEDGKIVVTVGGNGANKIMLLRYLA